MTAGEEFLRDVDAVLGAEPISVQDALAQIAADPEEAIAILDRTDRPFTFVARETARTRLTAALAQAGVRAPARVVDAWLGPVIRTSGEARGSGGLIEFAPAEPCSEDVDGADVLTRVAAFARRYLVADEPVYDALALWIALTYFVAVIRVAPILAIVSAIWRSGKTKALEIVALMASRVLSASNVTPSVIFRVVDKFAPTLVVDELDSFLEVNQELRGILNSGHTRAMAYVIRGVGDDYEPRRFSTWGLKAVALIGKLPPTLTDRSVVVQMRRRKKDEPVQVLDTSDADIVEEAAELRSQLARFAEDHPFLPRLPRIEFLDDRAGGQLGAACADRGDRRRGLARAGQEGCASPDPYGG